MTYFYKQLSSDDITHALHDDTNNSLSYLGARVLAEYLEETLEEPQELDIVAIRCEWTEYESIEDFNDDNHTEYEDIEELEKDFTVIKLNYDSGMVINNV